MKALLAALLALALPTLAYAFPVVSQQGAFVTVLNDTSTGTTLNTLTILTSSSPAKAIIASTSTTQGILGVTVAGAGTANAALIQTLGITNCVFDGPTTAGDFVQSSSTTAGNCHDAGASPTSTSIGQVTTTNGGSGTYSFILTVGAVAGGNLPINSLPAQTGNYNANGFGIGNVAQPANTGDVLIWNGNDQGNFNGVQNVLTGGVICDGATDNNASSSGILQTIINTACDNTHPGIVEIPSSCYGGTGHQLNYSTGISMPNNCALGGLGGAAVAGGGTRAVELDYTGSATAITTPTTVASNGVRLSNFRLKNAGTGVTGLLLSGAFNAVVDGVIVQGFSGAGIDLASNSGSSVNNDLIQNTQSYQNGYGLFLDATLTNTKNIAGITFLNDAFSSSTINNVFLEGFNASNLNVANILFVGNNIAEGFVTNIQCTNATDITFNNTFIENVNTPFSLTNCADIWAESTNVSRTGLTTTPVVTDGISTYDIDITNRIGGGTYHLSNRTFKEAYREQTALQDPTGQFGFGHLTNLILDSEDFTTGNWTTGGTGSRTANAATAPNGTMTATQVVKTSGYTIRGATGSLGALNGRCFVGSVWAQTASGIDNAYTFRLTDTGAANVLAAAVEQVTTAWKRYTVEGCAPSVDANTTILFYPLFATGVTPQTLNLWGAQVSEVPSTDYPANGAIPYVKTAATAVSTTTVGLSGGLATMWEGMTPNVAATSTDFIAWGETGSDTLISSEANAAGVVNQVGIASNLSCYVTTAAGASGDVMMVRKNSGNTTLTCTVTNTNTTCTDSTHNFTVAAGDKLDVSVGGGSNTNATGVASCSFRING